MRRATLGCLLLQQQPRMGSHAGVGALPPQQQQQQQQQQQRAHAGASVSPHQQHQNQQHLLGAQRSGAVQYARGSAGSAADGKAGLSGVDKLSGVVEEEAQSSGLVGDRGYGGVHERSSVHPLSYAGGGAQGVWSADSTQPPLRAMVGQRSMRERQGASWVSGVGLSGCVGVS